MSTHDPARFKVGINAWFWHRPAVGIGQYLHGLVPALLAAEPDLEISLISPLPFADKPFSPRLRQVVAPNPLVKINLDLARVWFEQVAFPRACRDLGLDLAHVPHYGLSLRPGGRSVVTVHDLIPMLWPAYRRRPLWRLYSRLIATATPRANIILTVSQASRGDIVRHLAVPPERVRVAYLAPAPDFRPVDDPARLAAVRQRYNLPPDYILYLGSYDSHKNIAGLLRAYARLAPALRARFPLVLAGSPGRHDPGPQLRRLGLEQAVRLAGRIAAADRPAVYSAATLFVYPSAYEGFGLPVLEAMACDTAVVTTSAASLPEIAGGAAWLVAPDDEAALAAAMTCLCNDAGRNQAAVRAGRRQVRRFCWPHTAAATMQAYREALAC